jgi:hypothetical protein
MECNKFKKSVESLLEDKENEMISFLTETLSPNEWAIIGEEVLRIMPDKGDIAKIIFEDLAENKSNII